jgi:phosphatidate cytidylyltransferase
LFLFIKTREKKLKELAKRVLVAVIGIPIGILIIYFGGIIFAVFAALVSSLALWEYYGLAEKKGAYPMKVTGLVFNLLLLAMFYVFFQRGEMASGSPYIIGLIILQVLVIHAAEMWSGKPNGLYNSSTTISGIFYITLSFCLLIGIREIYNINPVHNLILYKGDLLRFIDDEMSGFLVMIIFFSVWICDTAAYFTGRAIGRHKLFERVSPKKTWEGALGGFIGGILSFALFSLWLLPGLPTIHAAIMGAIVGSVGQIGDLAESLLKRDAGVKDSSNLLPGHGGALDRFDSILFVVPVIFIYIILFV